MTLKCKRVNNVAVTISGTLTAFFKSTIGSRPMAPLASSILVTSEIWRKQKCSTFKFSEQSNMWNLAAMTVTPTFPTPCIYTQPRFGFGFRDEFGLEISNLAIPSSLFEIAGRVRDSRTSGVHENEEL